MNSQPLFHYSTHWLEDVVQWIESLASEAWRERGVFHLALSGGQTPRPIYEALAQRPWPWDRVWITFSDERCVAPEDTQSNFHMAHETWLNRVPLPAEQVLRLKGELEPACAALEYEQRLKVMAVEQGMGMEFRHDLILLGLGADGHTASLFPGTAALTESSRWVIENFVPQLNCWRLTFTYPLLAAARQIAFLVQSVGKESVIDSVVDRQSQAPCAHVQSREGQVTWWIEV